MKKTKVILLAIALFGCVSPALVPEALAAESGQRVERGPRMRPGERPNRRPPDRKEMLKKMDANNDGGVSSDEFKSWGTNHPRPGNKTEAPEKIFTRIDKNQDGKLSSDEMEQGRGRHSQPCPNGGMASPSLNVQP